MRGWLLLLLLAAPAAAQKDFLTGDEIEQLREAQEPDVRLPLYVTFARQRVDMLAQLFTSKKTGRSGVIHDTLEQYGQIIGSHRHRDRRRAAPQEADHRDGRRGQG